MFSLAQIKAALADQDHRPADFRANSNHASVAMITVPGDDGLDVCFILRAKRDGDPWSGQVAFPGGRADKTDADAYAVAERETIEEIGLKLSPDHRVGALPIRPDVRGSLTLSPFIYHLPESAKSIARPADPAEVQRVFWVPLTHIFDEQAVTDVEYPIGSAVNTYPGIGYDGEIIWGLTLRILNSFADMMGKPLPVAY